MRMEYGMTYLSIISRFDVRTVQRSVPITSTKKRCRISTISRLLIYGGSQRLWLSLTSAERVSLISRTFEKEGVEIETFLPEAKCDFSINLSFLRGGGMKLA